MNSYRHRLYPIVAGLGCLLALVAGLAAPSVQADENDPADFALRVNDGLLDRQVTSAVVEPGEAIRVAARDLPDGARMQLSADGAGLSVRATGANAWRIEAPERPGVYPIRVSNEQAGTSRRVNLLVKAYFDNDGGRIDGYHVGHYESTALRGKAIYAPPEALMPVTPARMDTRLSEHFTLGQFLCHQQPDHWPKYVLVRPKLVAKLEAIINQLNERGIPADTLTVMSGYRTPQYNKAIGNTTSYSRHLFGGAADIYVDTNNNGRMDDLNGDGVVNKADADWLADLIDSLEAAEPRFAGGLSAYSANSAHGPFVHTDVRGVAARW